jgi:hypothetical protein
MPGSPRAHRHSGVQAFRPEVGVGAGDVEPQERIPRTPPDGPGQRQPTFLLHHGAGCRGPDGPGLGVDELDLSAAKTIRG